jgi:cysteine-rich repeat protein
VLRSAVGLEICTLLVCDVTGDLRIRASDALRLLQYAVGLPVVLSCPDISVTCGNGFLEEKETCDDGDALYDNGEFCNSACLLVLCGDTDDSGGVTIIDAQYILNASVDNVPCDDSICDITGNGIINSTDALRALMHAVGLPIDFNCPAPPATPPAPPIE